MNRFYCLCFVVIGFEPTNLYAQEKTVDAVILYCHDGDTCRIKINDVLWLNVRLFGIDAPEVKSPRFNKSQEKSEEAKEFLNTLLKDKVVQLVQSDLDHYNRPVVEIYFNKQLINLQLIEKGLAEVYRGKTKRFDKQKYLQAETKAKQQKVGIWSLKNYQSPQDFRRANKGA